MTPEERVNLVNSIVENVNYLNGFTLPDGQKLIEVLSVSNNLKDEKLIDLSISIPLDDFRLAGVFDISIVKTALTDISHHLPGQNDDLNSNARKNAEQKLANKDLSAKLDGANVEVSTRQVPQDEFEVESKKQAESPKIGRLSKVSKHIVNAIKLAA